MTSKVYVVQRPAFFDRTQRKFVDKFDISPAAVHGELVYLLGPGNIFRDRMTPVVRELRKALEPFTEADHILAIGDPVAIALTVLIAAEQTGGKVQLLKWDRIANRYESYLINTETRSA